MVWGKSGFKYKFPKCTKCNHSKSKHNRLDTRCSVKNCDCDCYKGSNEIVSHNYQKEKYDNM